MKDDRSQAIAARAYEIWERSGRPRGQAEAHWREAEEEIFGRDPPHRDAGGTAGPEHAGAATGDDATARPGAAKASE